MVDIADIMKEDSHDVHGLNTNLPLTVSPELFNKILDASTISDADLNTGDWLSNLKRLDKAARPEQLESGRTTNETILRRQLPIDRSMDEQGSIWNEQQLHLNDDVSAEFPATSIGYSSPAISRPPTARTRPVNYNPFAKTVGPYGSIAAKGVSGDTALAHLTPGDVTIPVEKRTPQIDAMLQQILGNQFDRFTVGNSANSINQATGLIQFEEGPGGGFGGDGPDASGRDSGNFGGADSSSPVGGNGVSMGGEIGTGHALGPSGSGPGFGGGDPGFGVSGLDGSESSPETVQNEPTVLDGIFGFITGKVKNAVQDIEDNPVRSTFNFGFNALTGPFGFANSVVSAASGGKISIGAAAVAVGQAIGNLFGGHSSLGQTGEQSENDAAKEAATSGGRQTSNSGGLQGTGRDSGGLTDFVASR